MRRDDKRGQFYLIAAIIIVISMIGFFSVLNYSKRTSFVNLYDLGEELRIESGEVLDYGFYNEFSETEIKLLLENFTESYAIYAGEGKNLYFIFGDEETIVVAGYQETTGNIVVNLGGASESDMHTFEIEGQTYDAVTYYPQGREVKVLIDGIIYPIDLKSGDYFYFVISQEFEGEKYFVEG